VLIEEDNVMRNERLSALVFVLLCAPQRRSPRRTGFSGRICPPPCRKLQINTAKALLEEIENGQTMYEAELTIKGHSKDVSMDANGNVVEIEERFAAG
jgi:hypothetical protein